MAASMVAAIAVHLSEEHEIQTRGTTWRHVNPSSPEGTDHSAQHPNQTEPGREIKKDDGVRLGEAKRQRTSIIAIHDPARLRDECAHLATPCRPVGLLPAW